MDQENKNNFQELFKNSDSSVYEGNVVELRTPGLTDICIGCQEQEKKETFVEEKGIGFFDEMQIIKMQNEFKEQLENYDKNKKEKEKNVKKELEETAFKKKDEQKVADSFTNQGSVIGTIDEDGKIMSSIFSYFSFFSYRKDLGSDFVDVSKIVTRIKKGNKKVTQDGDVVQEDVFERRLWNGTTDPVIQDSEYLEIKKALVQQLSYFKDLKEKYLVFGVSYKEFEKYPKELELLFKKLKEQKEKHDKQYKKIKYTPDLDFDLFLSNYKILANDIKKYLNKVLSRKVVIETLSIGDEKSVSFFAFEDGEENYAVARERIRDCILYFAVFPKLAYSHSFTGDKNVSNHMEAAVILEDVPELIGINFKLKKSEIEDLQLKYGEENELLKLKEATIYRPFFYADCISLQKTMNIPYARYLLGNMYYIDMFIGNNKEEISFKEFLSYFIRPQFIYSFMSQDSYVAKNRELAPLKKPGDVVLDRAMAYSEKNKKIQPNKKAKIDTGDRDELETRLREIDTDSMNAFFRKYRLDTIVYASLDCLLKYLPELPEIPNIRIPRYSYNFNLALSDPTGGMYKKFIYDLQNLSLSVFVKQIQQFFTAKDCDDLKKFFDKSTYKGFFKGLRASLEQYYKDYLSRLAEDLREIRSVINKNLCNPNVFFLSLATSEGDFTPEDISDILSGRPKPNTLNFFTDHVNYFSLQFDCEPLTPEEVNVVFTVIGRNFPEEIRDGYLGVEEAAPEIKYETKIQCENAFESYLEWLRANGIPDDVISCLKDTTLKEKNDFLEQLYKFADNNVTEYDGTLIAEDESLQEVVENLFNGSISHYFKTFGNSLNLLMNLLGSRQQPVITENEKNKFMDQLRAHVYSSPELEGRTEHEKNGYFNLIARNTEMIMEDSTASSSFASGYNVGEIEGANTGEPYWDIIHDITKRNGALKFDSSYGEYKISCTLRDGNEFFVSFKQQEWGKILPKIVANLNGERLFLIEDENLSSLFDYDYSLVTGDYRKDISNKIMNEMKKFIPDRMSYSYFDHFVEKEFVRVLQDRFFDFLVFSTTEKNYVFQDYVLNPGSSSYVNGVNILFTYLGDVINNQEIDGYLGLYSQEEFFNMFKEKIENDLKNIGSYNIEKNTKDILFLVKMRLVVIYFYLSILPSIKYSSKIKSNILSSYFYNLYPDINYEFHTPKKIDEDMEYIKNIARKAEIEGSESSLEEFQYSEMNKKFITQNLSGELEGERQEKESSILDGNITSDGKYDSLYTILTLRDEFKFVSDVFSKMLNNGNIIDPVSDYVSSLPFRHFHGHKQSIFSSELVEFYNQYKNKEANFDIFNELYYYDMSTNIRKSFQLPSFSLFLQKEKDYYASSGIPAFSVFDILDSSKPIPDFYYSVSMAYFGISPFGNSFSGPNIELVRFIVPIAQVKISREGLISYISNLSSWKQKSDIEKWEIIKSYVMSKLFQDKDFRLYFDIFPGLYRLFYYYQVFLYELEKRTSDVEEIFRISVRSNDESEKLKNEMEEKNSKYEDSEAQSDTYGLIKALNAFSPIQKMALQMARETPKLIFKAFTETVDPNIRIARKIVDYSRMKMDGKQLDIRFVSLVMLLPQNIWPAPIGIGPPITPYGLMYLAFGEKFKILSDIQKDIKKQFEKIDGNVSTEDYYLEIIRNILKNAYIKKIENIESEEKIYHDCII